MTSEEKSGMMFRAIAMSNRVSVARVKLQRAKKLSDSFSKEIKDIDKNICSLADCFIIGDDVTSDLDNIDMRIMALESRV